METINEISREKAVKTVGDRIKTTLKTLEEERDIKILYAAESGSRAWGFASADSDYDVRFVYVRKPEWYLSINVENKRDVVELPIDSELDVVGWDLRKACKLLTKSNPSILEWLTSPIIYRNNQSMRRRCMNMMADHYLTTAGHYHYLNMAKKNYRGYLKSDRVRIKKYFYVLRPLLCVRWIEKYKTLPPMDFRELLEDTVDDDAVLMEVYELMARKRLGFESDFEARNELLNGFIDSELAKMDEIVPPGIARKDTLSGLDRIFRRELADAWS